MSRAKPIECELCGGTGVVAVPHIETVTREMALDAGLPGMEGTAIEWGSEPAPCPECEHRATSLDGAERDVGGCS